jgi:hypothetical protein
MNDDAALVRHAERHHHLLAVGDLAHLAVSTERWRRLEGSGLWVEVTPTHFRHAATPLTFEMQVRAGAAWLGRDAALFGGTALRWLGVDVPEPASAEFLIPRRRRGTVGRITVRTSRRWSPGDVVHHQGVRTTKATRALIDLATVERSARVMEDAIDAAIRARRTSLPSLQRRLAELSGRGRTGCRLLRELLLDSGGESFLERRFLALVRRTGIARPRAQVVFRINSTRVARVDFLFGTTVVEVSGRLGHSSDRDRQRDARRRNALQQQGLLVLEFTTADVIDDPAHVISTLRRSLTS